MPGHKTVGFKKKLNTYVASWGGGGRPWFLGLIVLRLAYQNTYSSLLK